MTRVVISQPMYFPWVGFMAQMALADVMIWLDDAQFSKGSFTNRVQVRTADGIKWISVPLVNKGNRTLISDLKAADQTTAERHSSLLQASLSKAAFFGEAQDIFHRAWLKTSLVDTLIESAEGLARAVGLPERDTHRASSMDVAGTGSARVLDLVRAVGGSRYITGHGARNYLDHQSFDDAGVEVEYMKYQPLAWPQGHGAFTPYVTTLDLVAQVPGAHRRAHLAPQTVGWRVFTET
mgnify:FL=1